jgi:uncharacterized coiled-coil protein SlyX
MSGEQVERERAIGAAIAELDGRLADQDDQLRELQAQRASDRTELEHLRALVGAYQSRRLVQIGDRLSRAVRGGRS